MTNTFHGMSAADVLAYVPHFPSVDAVSVPTAVPISAGAMTSMHTQFGISKWTNSWVYRFFTVQEKFFFVNFWMSVNGGVGGFWLPSWLSDFSPSNGISAGDTHLDILPCDFHVYFDAIKALTGPYSDPTNIPKNEWAVMVMERDRTLHFRGIESVTETRIDFWDPSGAGLPHDINMSDIVLISLVRYARFNSGELDIQWNADNSMVDISAAFTELLFEGALA